MLACSFCLLAGGSLPVKPGWTNSTMLLPSEQNAFNQGASGNAEVWNNIRLAEQGFQRKTTLNSVEPPFVSCKSNSAQGGPHFQ